MQYTVCEQCGQRVSNSNLSKHLRRHENHPETFVSSTVKHDGCICMFCNKELPSERGRISHESTCKLNPNRKLTAAEIHKEKFSKGVSHPAWNKGLTKDTDERLRTRGEKLKARYQAGELIGTFKGKTHSDETKQLLREIALKNELGGHPYRNHIEYNGVTLDSTLELSLARRLDALGVRWKRPGKFNYISPDGVHHTYTPDFYLPEYDIYLDPKNDYLIENINPSLGYRDVDKIKWVIEQNNIKVIILDKEQVNNFCIDNLPRWPNG